MSTAAQAAQKKQRIKEQYAKKSTAAQAAQKYMQHMADALS